MPTKPLDRLIFAQGGLCFFCKNPLSKSEASIEHLVASANGGSNKDENCVACCKAVNALFGRMSLKEKIQVVLNQKGQFKCPAGIRSAKSPMLLRKISTQTSAVPKSSEEKFNLVLTNLKERGDSRPATLKKLANTIATLLPNAPESELSALLQRLQSTGNVTVAENKITYSF